MRNIFLRLLLGCALLPPGKIYIFSYGKKAEKFSESVKKICPHKFTLAGVKEITPKSSDVDKIFSKGDDEFEKLEFLKAVKLYEEGFDKVKGDLSQIKSWRLLIRALVRAGLCYIALRRYEDAKRVYISLLRVRPNYKPSPVMFPPQARRIFQKAKEEVKYCSIRIETFPERATVYIDGLKSGVTPLLKRKIPCGKHLIVIERNGYKRWEGELKVKDGSTHSIFLKTEEVKPPFKSWWTMSIWDMEAMCKQGSFPNSLFVKDKSMVDEINVIYCGGKETFIKDIPYESSLTILELISRRYTRGGSSILKSWWFWTTIVLLAGGLGAGIYLGAVNHDGDKKIIIKW